VGKAITGKKGGSVRSFHETRRKVLCSSEERVSPQTGAVRKERKEGGLPPGREEGSISRSKKGKRVSTCSIFRGSTTSLKRLCRLGGEKEFSRGEKKEKRSGILGDVERRGKRDR